MEEHLKNLGLVAFVSVACLGLLRAVQAQPTEGANASATPRVELPAEIPCDKILSYDDVQGPVQSTATTADAPARRPPMDPATRAMMATLRSHKPQIPMAPQLQYRTVDAPSAPSGSEFGNVASVAALPNGNVLVYQRNLDNELLEYDSSNRLIRSINPRIASRPHGLRVDKTGNIWITDVACHTVMKLDPTGKVVMTLGTKGKAGTWDESSGQHVFNQPTDVGFGPNGDIFVSTGHGGPDPRIVRFDRNGKFIKTWSLKHPDGSVADIHTMVVDSKGNVYAGDREVMKIYVYDSQGNHLRDMQMSNYVCGLFVDAKGRLWMTAGQEGMLMRLDWSGKTLEWTGKIGKGPNEYGEAHYLSITPDMRTIYVADTVDNRVMRLEASGH